MAKLKLMPGAYENFASNVIGKNSEVLSDGDLVTTTGAAGLKVAAAGEAIIGVKIGAETMTSTNATVAFVKPTYMPLDQDYEFEMDTNADLSVLVSPGSSYNITGTTGAIVVDVLGGVQTGATAIVTCTKVDPSQLGGTGVGSGLRVGLFKITKIVGAEN